MAAVNTIMQIKKSHPNNLMAKNFDKAYYDSLDPALQKRLLLCCKSGIENPDSGMGVYAMYPDDYDVLKPFMGAAIKDYHKIKGEVKHVTNWDTSKISGMPADGALDLAKLGLGTTSMRPQFGGRYHSLTPGTPESISQAEYQQLVDAHVMFKDMSADPYLNSAGISKDWPYGRGCYQSADKGFIVWVGEEDHLRIMCMAKGTLLNDVFGRLEKCLKVMDGMCSFAHSKDYGYVTSCPTNLGTGMRASIHIALPKLTKSGTDEETPKKIAKALGLSVRGVGGEHTAMGADGTVDISPSARLCIQEAEVVAALYKGIKLLMAAENRAGGLVPASDLYTWAGVALAAGVALGVGITKML